MGNYSELCRPSSRLFLNVTCVTSINRKSIWTGNFIIMGTLGSNACLENYDGGFLFWHDACDDNLSLTSSFPLFQPRTECENFPHHPFEPFGWDGVIILHSEDSWYFSFLSFSSTSLENCWDQKAIPWSGSRRTLWPKWLCLAAVLWRTNRRYRCLCTIICQDCSLFLSV